MSGVKQKSRFISDIDPDDLLECTICTKWKTAADNFTQQHSHATSATMRGVYKWECNSCKQIYNSLREVVDGKLVAPSYDDVRKAIANGAVAIMRNLNRAGHGNLREALRRDPEVEAALGILRDAKAQRQGRQGYVYLVAAKHDQYGVKVGYSTNPQARLAEMQTSNPRILILLAKREGTKDLERDMHAKFLSDNIVGEWFRPSPELFKEFGLKWTKRNQLFRGMHE